MWNLLMGNSESSASSGDDEAVMPMRKPELSPSASDREDGDGQETTSSPSVLLEKQTKKTESVQLPSINITLDKLPPIKDEKGTILFQKIPKSPLIQIPPPSEKPKSLVTKKNMEAKFVPYEPYKAAITPIHNEPFYLQKCVKTKSTSAVKEATVEASTAMPMSVVSEETTKKINELEKKLKETERDLKIQVQVNNEVKKLLVASVGEDMEARVDFLTQDKARLASDLRQYTSRISRDFEEKEHLSVESDLWKSKFLACSLIIDELARWKANLLQKTQEYDHSVRVAQHEHSVQWKLLMEALELLTELKNAFNPLEDHSNLPAAASMIGIADIIRKTVLELKNRLMADLKPSQPKQFISLERMSTPAEEKFNELLNTNGNESNSPESLAYNELACNAVAGVARHHLLKLQDKRSSTNGSNIQCCNKCQGTVMNI